MSSFFQVLQALVITVNTSHLAGGFHYPQLVLDPHSSQQMYSLSTDTGSNQAQYKF